MPLSRSGSQNQSPVFRARPIEHGRETTENIAFCFLLPK